MRLSNDVGARNIYPTMQGSLGIASTSPSEESDARPESPSEAARASAGRGNPLAFWLVAVGLLFLLMFTASRLGEADDFKSIRGSAYNVLFIALVAVAGIPIIKLAVSKLPVPTAAKDYVLSV